MGHIDSIRIVKLLPINFVRGGNWTRQYKNNWQNQAIHDVADSLSV